MLINYYVKTVQAAKIEYPIKEICPVCSKPDNGSEMICCDGCEYWFHLLVNAVDSNSDITYMRFIVMY